MTVRMWDRHVQPDARKPRKNFKGERSFRFSAQPPHAIARPPARAGYSSGGELYAFGSVHWEGVLPYWLGIFVDQLLQECTFGVHLFFLLSGFLIGGILLRAKQRSNYYKNFYISRMLRIIPVYLLVLAILKVWQPVSWHFVLAAVLFLANFSRLFGAPLAQYGSLWSLAVEEHFYLVYPTCVRRLKERSLFVILMALIVAEPLLRLAAIHIRNDIDIRFKTPFVLDYIAYGALIAVLAHQRRVHTGNARTLAVGLIAVSVPLILLSMWLGGFHYHPELDALRPVPWMWLCMGALLLGLRHDSKGEPRAFLRRPAGILPFFGYISYGLYLINIFTNAKIGRLVDTYVRAGTESSLAVLTAKAILSISIATGLAYLSRRFFEEPILQWKHVLIHQPRPQTPAAPIVTATVARKAG